jgi:hypothetical protein
MTSHYPQLRNVWIADSDREALEDAERRFGFRTLRLDGNERLPVADKAFDIVFCSAVIEHITGPKEEAPPVFKWDGRRFAALAFDYQNALPRRCAGQGGRVSFRHTIAISRSRFIPGSPSRAFSPRTGNGP